MAPLSLLPTTSLNYLLSYQIDKVAFRDLGRMAQNHMRMRGNDCAVTGSLASETQTKNQIWTLFSHRNTTKITQGLAAYWADGIAQSWSACPAYLRHCVQILAQKGATSYILTCTVSPALLPVGFLSHEKNTLKLDVSVHMYMCICA